jgi:hypothetical protein
MRRSQVDIKLLAKKMSAEEIASNLDLDLNSVREAGKHRGCE